MGGSCSRRKARFATTGRNSIGSSGPVAVKRLRSCWSNITRAAPSTGTRSRGRNCDEKGPEMKTVDLGSLPPGTQVRGVLYDDPAHVYGLGDVLEVELPTGLTIDVGWDEDCPEGPFRLTIYREYFGDHFLDLHVRDIAQVV